jgi:hypothetical protein
MIPNTETRPEMITQDQTVDPGLARPRTIISLPCCPCGSSPHAACHSAPLRCGAAALASPSPQTVDVHASTPQKCNRQTTARQDKMTAPRSAFVLVRGGGSGGIRTPGPLRVARFQVICAHVQTGPRML